MKIKSEKILFVEVQSFKSKAGKDLFKLSVADCFEKAGKEVVGNKADFFINADLFKKVKGLALTPYDAYLDLDMGLAVKGFEYKVYVNDVSIAY